MRILVIFALLFMQVSFCLHVYFLLQYILQQKARYLHLFIITFFSNMTVAVLLMAIFLYRPEWVQTLDVRILTWLMSGMFMVMMILIKIGIFIKIWRKTHDPENFHYNFFGKRVIHSKAVEKPDIAIFLFTIPVFLMSGAYFMARLINYCLYNHL